MSFQNIMSSPEPKMPKRVAQTATPNMARRQPTDFAPPEPSPKSSAAAHALLLCQQQQTSSKNSSESLENEKKRPAPAPTTTATVAFPTPQQQMTHVTPSYPLPPGWHPQYAHVSSPPSAGRISISSQETQGFACRSFQDKYIIGRHHDYATTTTPRQHGGSSHASSVAQYFATPYAMYAMNGMPPMAYGGQVLKTISSVIFMYMYCISFINTRRLFLLYYSTLRFQSTFLRQWLQLLLLILLLRMNP